MYFWCVSGEKKNFEIVAGCLERRRDREAGREREKETTSSSSWPYASRPRRLQSEAMGGMAGDVDSGWDRLTRGDGPATRGSEWRERIDC